MKKWLLLPLILLSLISCQNPTYQISFDSLGAGDIPSVDVGRNETISVLPTPTKTGYTFLGWYLDSSMNQLFDMDTIITDHLTLYAGWEVTSYLLTFQSFDGTIVNQETVLHGSSLEDATALITPSREGYTFAGWTLDESNSQAIDPAALVTGNLTLYAKWEINHYLLTFNDLDGSIVQEILVPFGSSLGDLAPNLRMFLGYSFVGWDPVMPETMPASALTLTAIYQIIPESIQSFPLSDEPIVSLSTNVLSSAVVTASGRLFKWGREGNPQWLCGPYDNSFDTLIPRDITNYFDLNNQEIFTQVQLGLTEHLVLTNQGRVLQWSYINYCSANPVITDDPLVVTDLTPLMDLESGEIVTQISSDGYHYLFLTSRQRIFSMRLNAEGSFQLDIQTISDITSRFSMAPDETAIKVYAGHMNSLVLTSQGRLFVFGVNVFFTLGIGTINPVTEPMVINEFFALAEGETIADVSLGRLHMMILTSHHRVFTTGVNTLGTLGDGTTTDSSSPIDITAAFQFDVGDAPAMIFAGYHTSFLVTDNDILYAWGANSNGQLGDSSQVNQLSPLRITDRFDFDESETILFIDSMIATPILVTSSGTIYIWGDKTYSILLDELS
jgi:uncharacterized repeat protein (TIGR02543 family)